MGKTRELTEEERLALDESWQEVGESIAAAVVDGGRNLRWAWEIIGPLGLYKRWMLDAWIERYEKEHPKPKQPPKKPGRKPTGAKRTRSKDSIFTKREQIHQALKLLQKQIYG
jgi:hypothetical protein